MTKSNTPGMSGLINYSRIIEGGAKGILKHFKIKVYSIESNRQSTPTSKSFDFYYFGFDRYKDFIVLYDIDQHDYDWSVYIIYDKTKNFNPKNVFDDVTQFSITELLVKDSDYYRITKISVFEQSNLQLVQLVELVKRKLQFYPLVDQTKLHVFFNKFQEAIKEDKGYGFPVGFPENVFMVYQDPSMILGLTIFPFKFVTLVDDLISVNELEIDNIYENTYKVKKVWQFKRPENKSLDLF